MKTRETIIRAYIAAYNRFDIAGMLADLHPDIHFENISDGAVNMQLDGVDAFRTQAEQAAKFFTHREQTITAIHDGETQTEVEIDYAAVLAIDLPNGLKHGDALRLKGKSIFVFSDDKIIRITDVSGTT